MADNERITLYAIVDGELAESLALASADKIGNVLALDDAVAAFNRTVRIKGKTIIRVRP